MGLVRCGVTRPASQSLVWAVERQLTNLGLSPGGVTAQAGSSLKSRFPGGPEGGTGCPAWTDDAQRETGAALSLDARPDDSILPQWGQIGKSGRRLAT